MTLWAISAARTRCKSSEPFRRRTTVLTCRLGRDIVRYIAAGMIPLGVGKWQST
jgi:hypothetical protein